MAKTTKGKFDLVDANETAYSQLVTEANANWQKAENEIGLLQTIVFERGDITANFAVGDNIFNATFTKFAECQGLIVSIHSGLNSIYSAPTYAVDSASAARIFIRSTQATTGVKLRWLAWGSPKTN